MRELTSEEVKAVSGGLTYIGVPTYPSIPGPIPTIPGDTPPHYINSGLK